MARSAIGRLRRGCEPGAVLGGYALVRSMLACALALDAYLDVACTR
jgi:hypothetical protein